MQNLFLNVVIFDITGKSVSFEEFNVVVLFSINGQCFSLSIFTPTKYAITISTSNPIPKPIIKVFPRLSISKVTDVTPNIAP